MAVGEVVAFVVERADFDLSLAEQAQAAGAVYWLASRCGGILRNGHGEVWARIDGRGGPEEVRARAVVPATGVRYRVTEQAGARRPGLLVNTAQAEAEMAGVEEVEVYPGAGSAGVRSAGRFLRRAVVRSWVCARPGNRFRPSQRC